ncbi:MAG: helix-turn-helix domain-containing protein [Plesiomonas sp.]
MKRLLLTLKINHLTRKEREMQKIHDGFIPNDRKKPVIQRIAELVDNHPSRRQAAQAWGINYSTLQNYFKRADQEPIPRRAVLEKIAKYENVAVEWLLTGINTARLDGVSSFEAQNESSDVTLTRLIELLSLLNPKERDSLVRLFSLKGIESVLSLLDATNFQFLQLPTQEKERLMALHEAKKGASQSSIENSFTDPLQKNAG